ncbi:hypothetical protein BKA62DRAFT_744476 [Auriculariales sp. MPI-PUGE-AT-0066]|nr:hypothetical protein BKA62DRAFT_744476 [Auriculariales sp. MPI-PUGE-AT-0066]
MTSLLQLPPFTRALCVAVAATSVPVVFDSKLTMTQYEVWRPISTFLYAGPGSGWLCMWYLFFLQRVVGAVEQDRFVTRPSDLLWQAFLASSAILTLNIPLSQGFYFPALLMAFSSFLYTSSFRTHLDIFEGFVNIPTVFVVPCLLIFEVGRAGHASAALSPLAGALVGFLWAQAVKSKSPMLTAPGVLQYALPDQPEPQNWRDEKPSAPPRFGARGISDLSKASQIRPGPKLSKTHNFRNIPACGSCG